MPISIYLTICFVVSYRLKEYFLLYCPLQILQCATENVKNPQSQNFLMQIGMREKILLIYWYKLFSLVDNEEWESINTLIIPWCQFITFFVNNQIKVHHINWLPFFIWQWSIFLSNYCLNSLQAVHQTIQYFFFNLKTRTIGTKSLSARRKILWKGKWLI